MTPEDPLWRRYLRFVGPDPKADVDDELQYHWEELVRRYRAEGMDATAAERAARAQFGDLDAVRDSLRARSVTHHRRRERASWWRTLRYDARIGTRKLLRQRGFTAAAVATLALGIGANAAVFSVVNSALLRPLPYPDAGRIVQLLEIVRGGPFTVSPPNFMDWRAQTRSFTGIAAFNVFPRTLTGYGDAQPVPAAIVTEEFFAVLGVHPSRGRLFSRDELTYGQTMAVILSDELWRSTFGSRDIVGQTIELDGRRYAVAGIMPPGFDYPSGTKLWTPWALSQDDLATQRGAHYLTVVARMRPGVTVPAAARDVAAVSDRLATAFPATNKGNSAIARSLRDSMVGSTPRRALLILLGAVVLVALIACANVANLLLARATVRRRELAMRAALGARPRDLISMVLTESVLLAIAGGATGAVLAWGATRALDALRPDALRQLGAASVDLTVLAFTLAMSIITGLLFGLAPAVQAARAANAHGTIQAGGRSETTTREGSRVRGGLVAAELAFALMLLAGAGLLIRSFGRLQHVDAGFDASGLLTFQLSLPDSRYPKADQAQTFYEQLLERSRALPGVAAAAAITGLPLDDFGFSISTYSLDGRHIEAADQPSTQIRIVTPDLFRALRITVRRGRVFTDADRAGAPNVAIMNEAAAKLLFNQQDPLGHSLEIGTGFGLGRGRGGGMVVGVVADIHDDALGLPPRPTVYLSHAQFPVTDMAVVLRATPGVDPLTFTNAARQQLRSLDSGLPMFAVRTMDHVARASVAQPRFAMLLLTTFAVVALALAMVGIFGVMSYTVGQRTRDIGVRMALGAGGRTVVGEVLRRAMTPVIVGVGLGTAGALAMTKTMTSLLYDVTPNDPVTFGAVAIGLSLVALGAAWLPARRASRVDPVVALRGE